MAATRNTLVMTLGIAIFKVRIVVWAMSFLCVIIMKVRSIFERRHHATMTRVWKMSALLRPSEKSAASGCQMCQ
jgi:hypothetical protein